MQENTSMSQLVRHACPVLDAVGAKSSSIWIGVV
jgi:hypothetical protein